MPDLLRVSVMERLARLAEGARPKVQKTMEIGTRDSDATQIAGKKSKFGRAWRDVVHQSLRSDGASLGGTLPRVKVVTRATHSADESRGGQAPAPQVQTGGRDADDDAVTARRILPKLANQAPTRFSKGSRAAGEDQGDRGWPLSPETSPERVEHDANRPPPQVDRIEAP